MTSKPLSRLIVIDGIHLVEIEKGENLNQLISLLDKLNFVIVDEVINPSILVFKIKDGMDYKKQTHVMMNMSNVISDILYYKSAN